MAIVSGARLAPLALCAALMPLSLSAAVTMTCEGDGWTLDLMETQARLSFPSPTDMDIPHSVSAEGADWPKALTLLGDRDTASVLLHDRACDGGSHEVQVLTQRAQTPILLQGCCQEATK